MTTTMFDRAATRHALEQVTDRLINVVSSAPDPTVPVPATPDWTVAQAFAHVVSVAPRYRQGPRREGEWVAEPSRLADLNDRQLSGLGGLDITRLAARLREDVVDVCRLIDGFGDRQPSYRFHGGETVAADRALGILLGELVVHGHDLARALGRPWVIDPAHVDLIMQGVAAILPGWVNPERSAGHTARYEVRLRGGGVYAYAFTDGRLRVNPRDEARPDVVISGDPAVLLLVLYRRLGPWRPVMTGKLIAWGRRPWLALSLPNRFHRP